MVDSNKKMLHFIGWNKMLQCFLGLLSDYPHSQGELSAEGLFGASDLLSDLRCNGVHCREQL